MTDTADRLRTYIIGRLDRYPDLNLHLVSVHCNGAALRHTEAEALDAHDHEHHGPGGIRNHDEHDLYWDAAKVAEVLIECAVMDAKDESFAAMRTAVDALMRRPNTIVRTAPDEHTHLTSGALADWDGNVCVDGTDCAVYPRLYDVRVEHTPEGRLNSTSFAAVDTPSDDITRGLLAAVSALAFAQAVAEDPRDPRPGLLSMIEGAQAKLRTSIAMLHPRLYPDTD